MTSFEGRALAVVNPVAGNGRPRVALPDLVSYFKKGRARVDIVRTSGPGDGARLARLAVEDGYAKVIAVGGDGTVHDVVNGLIGSKVALAVIPLGSANDFAYGIGLRDWREAARLAVLGDAKHIDVALANGRAFVNAAGVGVDAAGVRRVERHKRLFGPLAYATSAIATLATFRSIPLRVTFDGERIEGRHVLVVVANGERFGNGMRIAPGARLDDGVLDVCIIGDAAPLEVLWMLPTVYRGTHVRHPKVRIARVRRILIEQERRLPLELDGELTAAERVEVDIQPGALAVVAP